MFIRHLTSATRVIGVDNAILSLEKKPVATFDVDGLEIHQAREDFNFASTGFSYESISVLHDLARDADIIHYHFPWPFMDVAHFAARIKKPTVVTYHSDIVRQKILLQFYRPLMNAFLRDVDALVATSPNYLKSSPVLQRYAAKTSVITIGLNESLYPCPKSEAVAGWRKKIGERFFLFVGVLRYYKGLHVLLDAIAGTNIPLVIVGAGPIEHELAKQARKAGLHNVYFMGQVSEQDKVDLMEACYGLVFPSHLRSEAFGIGLLEGAMFGKPLICSEIGTGTSYINIHGETGLVVPPENPWHLRDALLQLWNNPALAQKFGTAARARYEKVFTSNKMGQRYKDLYERVIER